MYDDSIEALMEFYRFRDLRIQNLIHLVFMKLGVVDSEGCFIDDDA